MQFPKRAVSERVLYTLIFCFFVMVAGSYLYILLWSLLTSLRDFQSIAADPFGLSGVRLGNFRNYVDIIPIMSDHGKDFWFMLWNSIYFCFFGSFLCIFVVCMFAYVTSKYRFFGSRAIYFIVLIVITLPVYGSSSAMYKLLNNTGILNSRWMILTSLNGFSIYYLYFHAFFSNLSWSFAEAAEIDGANEWRTYFSVMLPQTVPMFGSLFLMLWIFDWNNYSTALLYLSKLPTLAVGIYQFKIDTVYESYTHILFAACIIATIPPLLLFILCNNLLLNNVSLGGIKE